MANKKLYRIITILLLVFSLGLIGILGYNILKANRKIEVPDFVNKSVEEVNNWCGSLPSKYACTINYEKSKTIDVNYVISQSINSGEKLENSITFVVSNELIKEIALPDIKNASKEDIKVWANKNKISNIKYVEQEDENIEYGKVIKIEPNSGIYEDSEVTVYLSSSNKKETNGPIKVNASEFIGLTVDEFKNKTKALGLNPNHNSDKDTKSNSVDKGRIVWHGSGEYEKNETINYGLSLGKSDSSSSDNDLYVTKDKYVGKTENDFISIAKTLGLNPTHLSSRDAYSDSIAKGSIVTHGNGQYEKGEAFNYGLSLGKKDGSSSDENDLYINKDKYVGKSESDFISIAKSLGLNPTHISSRDSYSDTVAKGNIVTHGYGQYEKNEAFNYGLSLGKSDSSSSSSEDDLYINKDKYVGKSESDFISIAKSLGLNPTHISSRDDYSDTIAKGSIITHGYGQYEKNEAFNYGLSLGKKTSGDTTVNVESYAGKSESSFLSYLNSKGLKPGSKTQEYSSSVAKGNIISNDTGTKKAGDSINYKVSLGQEVITNIYLSSFQDIQNIILVTGSYNETANKAKDYLDRAGFTNYSIVSGKSTDDGIGVLLKITVDGNNHTSRKAYPANAKIVFTICDGYE